MTGSNVNTDSGSQGGMFGRFRGLFSSSGTKQPLLTSPEAMLKQQDHGAFSSTFIADEVALKGKNNLSTFKGVYVPCVLGIFGVILFLRMGWSVGKVGLIETLGIMLIAFVVDVLVIISMSALVTNGRMRAGGPYFVISRSLGPEFGGSVGFIFYMANAVSVTFYIEGFVEVVITSFNLSFGSCYWMGFLIGSVALLFVTAISLKGASLYSKVAAVILVIKMSSVCIGLLAFLTRNPDTANVPGFTGPSIDTLRDNLWPNTSLNSTNPVVQSGASKCGGGEGGDVSGQVSVTFFDSFGVLFPAFTGVMAGANMSGDLKDPAQSIPKGSILGMTSAMGVYFLVVIVQAMSVEQDALAANTAIMQDVAWSQWLVAVGVFASTFASALASITGASRILQALSRDELIPGLKFFGKGSVKADEPRRAVICTWLVAQAALFAGDLNRIAPIVSMFFLLTYVITCFTCWVLDISGTPNFRPMFTRFHWSTSLLGIVVTVTVMFLLDVRYASISMAVLVAVFFLIHYRSPVTSWGDVSQALIFHQVRKYLLRLDQRKQHVKNWRPHMLYLFPNHRGNHKSVQFVNDLKKGGLYIIGAAVVGDPGDMATESQALEMTWLHEIEKCHVKAFVSCIVTPSIRWAASSLTTMSGLGGMKPNSIILDFYEDAWYCDTHSDSSDGEEGHRVGKHIRQRRRSKAKRPRSTGSVLSQSSTSAVGVGGEGSGMGDEESGGEGIEYDTMDPSNRLTGLRCTLDEYIAIINDAATYCNNILLVRNFDDFDRTAISNAVHKRYVDVWISDALGNYEAIGELGLQLGYILHTATFFKKNTILRIVGVTVNAREEEVTRDRLKAMLGLYRVQAEVKVVCIGTSRVETFEGARQGRPGVQDQEGLVNEDEAVYYGLSSGQRSQVFNELVRAHSTRTAVVLLSITQPFHDKPLTPEVYEHMNTLTTDLPPTLILNCNTDTVFAADL